VESWAFLWLGCAIGGAIGWLTAKTHKAWREALRDHESRLSFIPRHWREPSAQKRKRDQPQTDPVQDSVSTRKER
jgi:hypothetical protein